MALGTECCYAELRLCSVSFTMNILNKPLMLSVITLNVVMLRVIIPSAVAPQT
jgi:hypothetical protein